MKKRLWKCKIFGIHLWLTKADFGYNMRGNPTVSKYRICDRCGKRETL